MREAAPAFVEDEADIIYRNGKFYMVDSAGPRVFERHIFLRNFNRAAKAIQEAFAAEGAEIIPFPAEELRAAH